MIVTAKATIKDHWKDWDDKLVSPPIFNREAYQKRINEITGLSKDGEHPILKLEWGGNEVADKTKQWDNQGTPIEVVKIPRHAIPRQSKIVEGVTLYIPIRRWIITQYTTKQQRRQGDNIDNTFTDENGVSCIAGDKEQYAYTPLIYIGDHSTCKKDCCDIKICLGDYKHPSNAELDWILEKTYLLQSERILDPYSDKFSDEDLAKASKSILEERLKKRQETDEKFDDQSKDWWNAHSHRITEDDPSVLSRGKYRHFYKDNKPV